MRARLTLIGSLLLLACNSSDDDKPDADVVGNLETGDFYDILCMNKCEGCPKCPEGYSGVSGCQLTERPSDLPYVQCHIEG